MASPYSARSRSPVPPEPKARASTRRLCAALNVSRSGYYATRRPSRRAVGEAKLVPVIWACYAKSRATHGRQPRILCERRALDYRFARKRVARLMRQEGVSLLGRRSAIDGRTIRHTGYGASQILRKRVEHPFGWLKSVAGLAGEDRGRARSIGR